LAFELRRLDPAQSTSPSFLRAPLARVTMDQNNLLREKPAAE
jgi:hypothetical protein